MKEIKDYLSKNVKFYRNKKGISQQALAESCKVSTYYIGGIERGHNDPSLKVLAKIAESLDVPVHMLLIDPDTQVNEVLDRFSEDITIEFTKMIEDLKKRY